MRSCERSLFEELPPDAEIASDASWFVYLLPLTDCSAFKVGFSCNPLQRIYSFSRRYFERFDLHAAQLLRLDECEQARTVEALLKTELALHRVAAPAWLPIAAGGHTEWFSAVHFARAQELLQAAHASARMLSGFDFIEAELRQRRADFELWACHLAQQLALARTVIDARRGALRDWLAAYRCFGIPLFSDDPAARQFVLAVADIS